MWAYTYAHAFRRFNFHVNNYDEVKLTLSVHAIADYNRTFSFHYSVHLSAFLANKMDVN